MSSSAGDSGFFDLDKCCNPKYGAYKTWPRWWFVQSWVIWSVVSMKSLFILLALVAISLASRDQCSYNCNGWPYKQCGMSSGFSSATCINPYTDTQGSQIFSNYPKCANVPSGCERCDDVCSRRDGNKDKLDYRVDNHQPSHIRRPPRQSSSHNKVCDYQCQSNGGCTATYVGRSRPGKHQGSCFPDEFGGSCSGTPNECHNCNQVLSCSPEEKQKSAFDTRHLGGNLALYFD